MANTSAPFGFRDIALSGGSSAPTGGMIKRQIAFDDSTKIYQGDPVKSLATGFVAQWTAGTAVSQLAGIFVGCEYLSLATGKHIFSKFWPGADVGASSEVTAHLIPCNLAPAPLFNAQSSGTAITLADVGANIDVALGTGSDLTGQSAATVDQSTIGAGATLPFRIMGLYEGVGNGSDATSSFNIVTVAANVSGAGSTGLA